MSWVGKVFQSCPDSIFETNLALLVFVFASLVFVTNKLSCWIDLYQSLFAREFTFACLGYAACPLLTLSEA